jgi:hypothetical protein
MSNVANPSANNGAGRCVSIRRDDEDFVVAFQPEDFVIFRNQDANALRKVCRFLRWEIVADTAYAAADAGQHGGAISPRPIVPGLLEAPL